MSRTRLAVLLGGAALALAACSGAGATPGATTPASPSTVASVEPSAAVSVEPSGSAAGAAACTVSTAGGGVAATIKDFAFSPNPVSAKVGEAITWTNEDSAPHTVSLDDGSCTSDRLDTSGTVTLTFAAPGSYPFHCTVHPNMKGTIQVTA